MKRFAIILLIPLFVSCTTSVPRDQSQPVFSTAVEADSIFAPVVTGTPPTNVFNRNIKLPDGEIRSYSERGRDYHYLYTHDGGLNWYGKPLTADDDFGIYDEHHGQWIRLAREAGKLVMIRSASIEGPWERKEVVIPDWDTSKAIMIRLPLLVQTEGGVRILVSAHNRGTGSYVFYSDNGGDSWAVSNPLHAPDHQPGGVHKGTRWNHGAVEPTILQLNSGKLWMILRTAQDNHYEAFSDDFGATWSATRPSRFHGTITMPTIGRLSDGRILMLWNNTTPLPEMEGPNGRWEDVFTNRDVLHAAISDDEGKSWKGFRELYLNPRRYDRKYATEAGISGSLDRSVHQTQFFELSDGLVAVAFGQHTLHRKFMIFHPDWLLEKSRKEDFSGGLANVSTQKYLNGVKGHCAYNRTHGASIVEDPVGSGNSVLKISRRSDKKQLIENDGAVWNFPGGLKGEVSFRLNIDPKGQGGQISLTDRWFNPTDLTVDQFAVCSIGFDAAGHLSVSAGNPVQLPTGEWVEIKIRWDFASLEPYARLEFPGSSTPVLLDLGYLAGNGLSYLHLISTAQSADQAGFLIDDLSASVN